MLKIYLKKNLYRVRIKYLNILIYKKRKEGILVIFSIKYYNVKFWGEFVRIIFFYWCYYLCDVYLFIEYKWNILLYRNLYNENEI